MRDVEGRRTYRSPDLGEKEPYLSRNISHFSYPGVYPIRMARVRWHGLTDQSGSQYIHLRSKRRQPDKTAVATLPGASELLAIFITPSYTG